MALFHATDPATISADFSLEAQVEATVGLQLAPGTAFPGGGEALRKLAGAKALLTFNLQQEVKVHATIDAMGQNHVSQGHEAHLTHG